MLKKYWRRFNTLLILVAFFAPWLRSCGINTFNGFQTTALFGIATSDLLSNSGTPEENQTGLSIPIVFVGLILILLYSLINLLFSFDIATQIFSRLKIGILIGGIFGMLGSLAWAKLSDTNLEEYLWGYWLTWLGLLSSLGAEITESRVKKQVVQNNNEIKP